MILFALEKALKAVKQYAEISKQNYKPQMLARPGYLNWDGFVKEVKKEVGRVKKINT